VFQRLKSVRDTAEALGVSVSTLNKWRVYGDGPTFVRLGRRIAYRPEHILEYLEKQARQSTSDAGDAA
jgi:predicted site-specific integrase-resolvase